MSRKPNVTLIGIFVIVGLILSAAGVVVLTSGNIFSTKFKVVSFFDESVGGLGIGAPLKLQGVVIGKVTSIGFGQAPGEMRSYIRVNAEIDVEQALSLGADPDFNQETWIASAIDRGLRASLATESMVTGVRYLELEYIPTAPEPVFLNTDPDFVEIPSIPSALAGLTESVTEAIARVGAIDIPQLTAEFRELLDIAIEKVEELDVRGLHTQLMGTMESIEEVMSMDEIQQTLSSMNRTLISVDSLARTLDSNIDPTLANLDSASVALKNTLTTSEAFIAHMEALTSEEGSFRYETEFAMRELGNMARTLQRLVAEIERNPDLLLRGRAGEPE